MLDLTKVERKFEKELNKKIECKLIKDSFQYYILVNNVKYALCKAGMDNLSRAVKNF